MLWEAAKQQLDDARAGEGFVNNELRQAAEALGTDLLIVLDRQLHSLDVRGRISQVSMARLASRALRLKGQLRAAPYYYEYDWIRSGERVNLTTMRDIRRREEPADVLLCMTPVVRWRSTKGEDWSVAARACVFAEDPPASEQL